MVPGTIDAELPEELHLYKELCRSFSTQLPAANTFRCYQSVKSKASKQHANYKGDQYSNTAVDYG